MHRAHRKWHARYYIPRGRLYKISREEIAKLFAKRKRVHTCPIPAYHKFYCTHRLCVCMYVCMLQIALVTENKRFACGCVCVDAKSLITNRYYITVIVTVDIINYCYEHPAYDIINGKSDRPCRIYRYPWGWRRREGWRGEGVFASSIRYVRIVSEVHVHTCEIQSAVY